MLSISCRRMKRPRSLSATSSPPGSSPEQKRALAQSIPVAIVGAGPAGMTLSSLLSRFRVPSILLEKTSALPTHPQAHFINVRTMEIMKHALGGLDRAIFEKCPPRDEWRLVQSRYSCVRKERRFSTSTTHERLPSPRVFCRSRGKTARSLNRLTYVQPVGAKCPAYLEILVVQYLSRLLDYQVLALVDHIHL